MAKMSIKKGDTVKILSGKDRGKQGTVLHAYPAEGKIKVEGVAVVKKAVRPNQQNQTGGIVVAGGRRSTLPMRSSSAPSAALPPASATSRARSTAPQDLDPRLQEVRRRVQSTPAVAVKAH